MAEGGSLISSGVSFTTTVNTMYGCSSVSCSHVSMVIESSSVVISGGHACPAAGVSTQRVATRGSPKVLRCNRRYSTLRYSERYSEVPQSIPRHSPDGHRSSWKKGWHGSGAARGRRRAPRACRSACEASWRVVYASTLWAVSCVLWRGPRLLWRWSCDHRTFRANCVHFSRQESCL